jgi:hypothetical protein
MVLGAVTHFMGRLTEGRNKECVYLDGKLKQVNYHVTLALLSAFKLVSFSAYSILIMEAIQKTPLSESASELYRPSDRRLSAKCQLLRIEGATCSA